MADRLNQEEPRKRQSGLLDAIFDVVEQAPEDAAAPEESLFRAKAIEQIDVPAQVDLLLPLTSRMTWIALVGAALVMVTHDTALAARADRQVRMAEGRAF